MQSACPGSRTVELQTLPSRPIWYNARMGRDIARNKAWKRDHYLRVIKPRRIEWFKNNGPCVDCGSHENLELDHDDPSTKIHHLVWTWAEKHRLFELAKCKVRCHSCHAKKSYAENKARDIWKHSRKVIKNGKAWCNRHGSWILVKKFTKDKHAASGLYSCCRDCRKSVRGRKVESL